MNSEDRHYQGGEMFLYAPQNNNASSPVRPPIIPPYSAPTKPSGYPMFSDGDVLIVSPTGKQWKLHSLILAQASPVLNAVLAEAIPAVLTKKDRELGKTIFFKLEMIDNIMSRGIDPEGMRYKAFRWVPVNAHILTFPTNINGLGDNIQYNAIYDNFFRCMYNLNPLIQHDEDPLERAYIVDCTALLQAAEYLGAISVVRVIVEAHLLRLNQVLWHHISEKAENWVHIAAKLESPLMFRECMVHLVGKFHIKDAVNKATLESDEHGKLGKRILELIEIKAKELKDKKLMVERNLIEFYPARMIHKEDMSTVPGRALYANDIYFWQSLTLCRQFIASAIISNVHHRASDGGMAFYRTIGEGTYLKPETLGKYHMTFDMSSKGRACLHTGLDAIKEDLKAVVNPILRDNSQATRAQDAPPFNHFTCTEVTDEELPWYSAPAEYKEEDINLNNMTEYNPGNVQMQLQ